jgi:hypothetical protein
MKALLDREISTWDELAAHWPKDQAGLLDMLHSLKQAAGGLDRSRLELVCRPGVSISLRFSLHPAPGARQRPVFHLIDVAEFDGLLFLSVCFYADEMSDPQELGNLVPLGLFNEDGYCFDLDQPDPEYLAYILERQKEAHQAAAKQVE